MARGILSGLIWGVVVAGAGAGGLSLAYPDFKPDAMQTAMAEPASASAEPESASDTTDNPVPQSQEDNVPAEADTDSLVPGAGDDTPVTPAQPDPVETDAGTGDGEGAQASVADTGVEPVEPAPVKPEAGEQQAAQDGAMSDSTAPEPDAPDQPDVAEPAEPVISPSAQLSPVGEEDPVGEPDATSDSDEASDVAADDSGSGITDTIIAALPKPQGTVGDLAPEVTTNRLPSVSEGDEEAGADGGAPAVAPPPIERFAEPAEIEEGKPLMAIVLIDAGDGPLGVEALEAFPYPITFAVDASGPDAEARMQTYRDKGFEVMAMASLPAGATASDAEVAMSAYLGVVPEAVAILESPDVSLQASREVSDQITDIVLESGHGLVLQSNGLNTVQKLARREGIPSATIFRDFDSKDQNASVIRRFLDQAAFKAGQEGGVIMLGRLRAETISALLIWGLADRASRVALVPVSAVLMQGDFTR